LGIPAVVAAGAEVLDVADGTEMIVDGAAGTVLIDPSLQTIDAYRAKADALAASEAAARSRAQEAAATTDGVVIAVAANIGSLSDLAAVAASGADSVGLLRTEFFFIERAQPPSASEQESQYRRIAEGVGGRRLTIRTLDAGGDKPLGYLTIPPEGNPFLGLRGIRLSLRHPEVLQQQLTAIVRVAGDHPVSVMFPMVTSVAELEEALAALEAVCDEQGGRPGQLEVGMMVEVPAVAANAAAFTPRVDFVSIGTNDLAQYALAAERGNQYVAHLADALDPGVLRLIQGVVVASGDDTRVAVCGELAADLAAVSVLVGLGVDELSVNRFAVPGVKDEVRQWSRADAVALAAEAIALDSAAAVRRTVAEWRRGR
jgi:phosphocarrier protein FPr